MKKNQSQRGREEGISPRQKIFLKMKVTFLVVLLSAIQVFANGVYSQNKGFTLVEENTTIENALKAIEDQSNYYFLYNGSLIDVSKKVNVKLENQSLENTLQALFKNADVSYKVYNRQIVLSPSGKNAEVQQDVTVTGNIVDISGAPLPGVTVLVKGTSHGTITDFDGNYSIADVPGNATLVFSFVGMKTQETVVGGQTAINVVLEEDAVGIEEVVAIGYGVTKKSDLTGAVTSVKSEDLVKVGVTSVAHALSGKAAGLNVSQNSAQPGGGLTWQIRGSATGRAPLIIVDGFPITGKDEPASGNRYTSGSKATTLNSINPNDIESIEILKDASATAIYGARAAGGVVIITTKRGSEGKVTVDYRGSYSFQKMVNMPEVLNPQEFMLERNKVKKEIYMRDNQVAPYGPKAWDEVAGGFVPYYTDGEIANFTGGTNWFDEVSQAGAIKQHNLTVTSGTKTSKYLISLSAYDQDGIVKTNQFGRYTGRINIDQELTKWLKTGISTSFSTINEDNVPLGGGTFENSGIIRSALGFNPTLNVKDENGNYVLDPSQSFVPNPVSLLEMDDVTKNEDLFVNSFLEATPLDGLTLKLSAGFNRNWAYRNTYLPTTTLWGASEGGKAARFHNGKQDYLFNFITNYSRTIAEDHTFNLMAGYEYQKFIWEGFNAGNSRFPYDGIKWYNLNLGEREKPIVGSYGGSSEIASYITRLNYSYKSKYLLTANLRVDGSSNFAENNQWGVFPGVSLAWRLTQEPFMENLGWISNLKLRAGYGQTGNDDLSGVLTYYTPGWNYGFGSISKSGIGLANIGNPDLKWETQTDLNIGLDFGFWNNRLSGTIEVYDRVVSDLLGDKPLLSYQAITKIKSNLDAEKQSRGIDLQVSSVNFDNDNFYWGTDLTFTYYRDRWRKRDASWKPDINSEEQAVWGAMWTYLSDGLVAVGEEIPHMPGAIPGTVKIKDVNGYLVDENGGRVLDESGKPQYSGAPDGKIDRADQVKIGYNVPIPVGLNNSFKYRNFDLNVFVHAMFNRWAVNGDRYFYGAESFRINNGANVIDEVKDRWTFDKQSGTLPSIFQANSAYGVGDYFQEEAWFIRLKNISLGYTLPKHILPAGFDNVRVFADAQNLFVITPFSGTDPETGSNVAYPNQRTFTAGVEIKF